MLTLAKMKEPLNIVWSRPLPKGCKPSRVTVSKDCAVRYFVSLLVEEEIVPRQVTPKMIGLDLGLKSMVITSNGETYGNPKFFAQDEKRLARVQRRHAKKKKGSKNKRRMSTNLILLQLQPTDDAMPRLLKRREALY